MARCILTRGSLHTHLPRATSANICVPSLMTRITLSPSRTTGPAAAEEDEEEEEEDDAMRAIR